MTWIFILLVLAFFAYLGDESHSSKRVSKTAQVVLILFLSYLTAFYGTHAQDHDNYVSRYNYFAGIKFSDVIGSLTFGKETYGTEFGYFILNVVCNQIGLGELGFFLIIALFVNVACVRFIYKRPMPMLSFMFIFSMNFALLQANLIRQFIAMSIFLIFFDFFERKNMVIFGIGLILMLLFHTSSILFVLLFPILLIKDSYIESAKYVLIILWILSVFVAIGVLKMDFMAYINMLEEYSKYADSTNDVGTSVSVQRILFFNIFCALSFISFYKKKFVLTSVFVLSVVFMNISNQYPNIARLYYYFSVLDYVFVSYMLSLSTYKEQKNHSMLRAFKMIMACYCIFRLLSTYVIGGNVFEEVQPYSWSDLLR